MHHACAFSAHFIGSHWFSRQYCTRATNNADHHQSGQLSRFLHSSVN